MTVGQKLYWLDLETSGLSPERDAILEIAVAEADLRDPFEVRPVLKAVFQFRDEHTYSMRCNQPPRPDGAVGGWGADGTWCGACLLSDWAREAHSGSGLLEECARSTVSVHRVEGALLDFVSEVAEKDDRPTLAGRGVHFDLGFLRVHMPNLAARLSHRVYDVSAVALFCESLGMPRIRKRETHRALEDLLESVDHARRCRGWLETRGRSGAST